MTIPNTAQQKWLDDLKRRRCSDLVPLGEAIVSGSVKIKKVIEGKDPFFGDNYQTLEIQLLVPSGMRNTPAVTSINSFINHFAHFIGNVNQAEMLEQDGYYEWHIQFGAKNLLNEMRGQGWTSQE